MAKLGKALYDRVLQHKRTYIVSSAYRRIEEGLRKRSNGYTFVESGRDITFLDDEGEVAQGVEFDLFSALNDSWSTGRILESLRVEAGSLFRDPKEALTLLRRLEELT